MKQGIYGSLSDGSQAELYRLCNENGLEVWCTNYGCRITDVLVPNRDGGKTNIVLGFDDLAGFEKDDSFQGAVVGRFANRIRGARFAIDGVESRLVNNEGENYLHGSFHKKLFMGEVIGENSVTFTYTSPEGEDGFPGELWVGISYTLTEGNELMMDYRAVAKGNTHVNLTNHAYFNLAGAGDVLGHTLRLNCDRFLETDKANLPTGRVLEVFGGAFDFLGGKPIGQDLQTADPQLQQAGGYDHCFLVNQEAPGMNWVAELKDPQSGRGIKLFTTQPGVQVYTGNVLAGVGRGDVPFVKHGAVCLETQHFPDSPNQPDFPPTLLRAGEKYRQANMIQFSW